MITKTFVMLFLLGVGAVLWAFGIWFAAKAYQGWQDSSKDDEGSESGWFILGTLGAISCLIALVRLAYHLAGY